MPASIGKALCRWSGVFTALALSFPAPAFSREADPLAAAVAAFQDAVDVWDPDALDEAAVRFEELSAKEPDSAPARYWHATALFHGCLYLRRADGKKADASLPQALKEAERNLKKAVERDPENGELHAMLATVVGIDIAEHPFKAVWRGRVVDRHKKAALARAPDNPRVQYLLGSSFLHAPALLGGRDKGLAYLLKAETLFEQERKAERPPTAPRWGYSSCLFFLAQIMEEQGKVDEALAYLRKTLTVNPREHRAEQALKRLQENETGKAS